MLPLTTERLEALLWAAERAHAGYEATLGRRDGDWPKWYAEYIVRQLEARA